MNITSQQEESVYLAAWAGLHIGASAIRKIESAFGNLKTAWAASLPELSRSKLSDGVLKLIEERKEKMDPEENWKMLQKLRITCITQKSPHYPEYLKEIPAAPLFLYAQGELSMLQSLHNIAVVGTRQISEYGRKCVERMIPELVAAGMTIVSGLAYGVDAYAHHITLREKGSAIAVLGSSLDKVYPRANHSLAKNIIESGGLMISEYAPGAPPMPQHFPARNRIISGLSKATLIIEAKKGSGSLITANFANEQGRDVFAVPGDIFSSASEGSNELIAQGATPVSSATEILEHMGLRSKTVAIASEPPELLFESEIERNIYQNLREPKHIDELARLLSFGGQELSRLLTMMELRGILKSYGGMRYGRA